MENHDRSQALVVAANSAVQLAEAAEDARDYIAASRAENTIRAYRTGWEQLVGLDVADITEGTDGLTVRLRRSKTDQEAAGRTVGIPYGSNPATCPVRAWRSWLEVSGITEGYAFRPVDRHGHIGAARLSGQAVALVLKRHAARVGLDPDEVAGHSLRAGLATSAAAAGVPERVIADQTGHKGTAMLRRYIREGSLFRDNAASAVGL